VGPFCHGVIFWVTPAPAALKIKPFTPPVYGLEIRDGHSHSTALSRGNGDDGADFAIFSSASDVSSTSSNSNSDSSGDEGGSDVVATIDDDIVPTSLGNLYWKGMDTHPFGKITPKPGSSFRGQRTCKCYHHSGCSWICSTKQVDLGEVTVQMMVRWCQQGKWLHTKEDHFALIPEHVRPKPKSKAKAKPG